MPSSLTLQINLSGGDADYAELTVPALVAAHRAHVHEVVAVVDGCRPQRTQTIDPDARFPVERFATRLAAIRAAADRLRARGVLDRVVHVEPGDPRIGELLRRYAGPIVRETHDCYGCGLVSYLYGFDECRTRHVLHYDADMLLHQAPGYHWPDEALRVLDAEPLAVAATPRVSPPYGASPSGGAGPSRHESDAFMQARDGYWRLGWFSARCYLVDLERFRRWLPLLGLHDPKYVLEVLARRLLARGYPPATEMMIHRRAQSLGAYRVDLMSEQAYLLHPNVKDERFLRMLPAILERVARGQLPPGQAGWENLKLEAWEASPP